MKSIFQKGKELVSSVADKVSSELDQGFSLVSEVVDGLPIFVSSEESSSYDTEYDEKHYFVIPYTISEAGFSLHTMRCLPPSVPEINDLPKRRVFHLPNEHYEASLRAYLLDTAKELAEIQHSETTSTLEQLANDIDALDSKLTYGMLLVGGIAAVFNPLVGVGIAAKAVTPGVAGLLNKYGLKPVGEKLSQSSIKKAAKEAEQLVIEQFSCSSTLKVVNPILQELELALRTTEEEHDPLTDFNLADGTIEELDGERWRELTETAVWHVYKDILRNSAQHKAASLGPEDIRWFKVLYGEF